MSLLSRHHLSTMEETREYDLTDFESKEIDIRFCIERIAKILEIQHLFIKNFFRLTDIIFGNQKSKSVQSEDK